MINVMRVVCLILGLAQITTGQKTQPVKANNPKPTLPDGLHCNRPLPYFNDEADYQKAARIVGGIRTKWNWPFIVRIRVSEFSFCGGALINSYWVITAAHCVAKSAETNESVEMTFGDQVVSDNQEYGEYHTSSHQFFVHPQYNSKKALNDIALIKLKEPVRQSPTISPVCLPMAGDKAVPAGTSCFIAGWGAENERYTTGYISDHLLEARVPIIKNATCSKSESYDKIFKPEMHICAGYMTGGQKDACQNDSGGPLICVDDQNQPVLTGVTSFGIGCARKNFPGVYTRVSAYANWINETVLIRDMQSGGTLSQEGEESGNNRAKCNVGTATDMKLAETTTALIKFGTTKCYGALISESYVVVSDRCVGSVADTEVFFRYQKYDVDFIMTDVEKGIALIRLVNNRDESMCIKTTKPDVDEHCITFDSDSFPNFFTVEHCADIDQPLGTIGFCFSDNPITNMYSAPIICNNHVVGFFANEATRAEKVFSIESSIDSIMDAIEKIENDDWKLTSDMSSQNPFLISLVKVDPVPISVDLSNYDYANLVNYDYLDTTTTTRFVVTTTAKQPVQTSTEPARQSDGRTKEVDYYYYNENRESNVSDFDYDFRPETRGRASTKTDFQGCKDMELAYRMDENIRIGCGESGCNLTCKKETEVPQITKIICKNSRRGKWGPKPTKIGALTCGLSVHQTKCGPVTEHFNIEGRTGVKVKCANNKCAIECPPGKFSTLPRAHPNLICRNSRRNIWNVTKDTRVACVSARKLEKSDSLKCGPIGEAYEWYKMSKVVAQCSGLRRKMEKCDLLCEDGSTPVGATHAVCNRNTRKFEPHNLQEPTC